MKKYFIAFIVVIFFAGGYFLLKQRENKEITAETGEHETLGTNEKISNNKKNIQAGKEEKSPVINEIKLIEKIKQNVPFVLQAPFGNWKDGDFQNGCEEASMIMADGWIRGVTEISVENSKVEIKELVKFEEKFLGYSSDTDIFDMEKIFRKYYKSENIKVRENIKLDDIKNELQQGNIILAPAFGRALGNPNYTSPGPITHMLVIIGYDPKNKKIIANDPGTKKGQAYEYDENILFGAIWQYPSGKKHSEPPVGNFKKSVLVVYEK